MKLLIAIAIVAILVAIVIAMQRGGTRITTIEHRREDDDADGDRRS